MAKNALVKGSLSILILQLLSEGSAMYGYEISQRLKELTGDQVSVKEGSLYPALHKLEAEGLVESYTEIVENRVRKYYSLSRSGKQASVEKRRELEDFVTGLMGFLDLKKQTT
jgi:DNA-binding PadR family transcriptional regulator